MKHHGLSILASLLLVPCSHGAITAGLVAYWGFEGNTNNGGSGGAAYNGTLMGDATTGGSARVGSGALLMDGSGDYMDVTSNVNTAQAWSVSAWFRSDINPATTVREMVFESSGSFAMSFNLREGTPTTNTNFQLFSDYVTGTDPQRDVQVADGATANTWHNIVLTFSPSTASATGTLIGYLDGTASHSITIPIGTVLTASNGFHVGTYRSADGRWFDGSIDEVAIWDRALDGNEAAGVFNAGDNGLAVPEPSVAMLGGLGVLLLFRRRTS
jgi:hypothetical protein